VRPPLKPEPEPNTLVFEGPASEKGEEPPLERLPLPKTDLVVSVFVVAAAPNGDSEPEGLAKEVSGLAPVEGRNGDAVLAKPESPELLNAELEVVLAVLSPAALASWDC